MMETLRYLRPRVLAYVSEKCCSTPYQPTASRRVAHNTAFVFADRQLRHTENLLRLGKNGPPLFGARAPPPRMGPPVTCLSN
ncbi:hypothetical protein NPIL_513241 [Nephila pilipes]|uniref:Uncharacterized protein n=1 Tax=Nephila pilipes TaxID=299642 RepID=A0A8X6NAM9_NEPPI|nr:hypothetical protein NPIL_513241 [Nephila pilipes]